MDCGNTEAQSIGAYARANAGREKLVKWSGSKEQFSTRPEMARIRSNRVCFTLNNYEETDIAKVVDIAEKCGENGVKYFVCGEEIGESGTRHLQGFINLDMDPKKCGIKFWKDYFQFSQAAHFENSRGTDNQNKTYCTKDEIFIEGGVPEDKQTSIHERIFSAAKTSVEEAVAIDHEFGIRNYNQLKQIYADFNKQVPTCAIERLREWQVEVINLASKQNDRQILFVVDFEGGKGKSELTKYLLMNHKAWACQGKLNASCRRIIKGAPPPNPRS